MRGEPLCTSPFLAALLFLALAGCDGSQPPDPATKAPASSVAQSAVRCDDGDMQCLERMYQLEETLAIYEAGVAAAVGAGAQECWKSDVATARRAVEACHDIACRQKALLARIASLHELQPADRRAAIALPPAPLLEAVIGPEPEAGPPATNSSTPEALAARGHLVHALDDPLHRGIAVRTDSGLEHVLILDADIGRQPTHQQVQELAGTLPPAQVLVRGIGRMEADGVPNFDASGCRLVYRLR